MLCALISNGIARPARRLALTSAPPPTAKAIPLAVPATPQIQPVIPPAPPVPKPDLPEIRKPRPQEAPKPNPVVPGNAFPLRPGQPIREISSREAAEAFQAGVPFLDARRTAEFELGRVRGAWSLPMWESTLEERLIEFEAKVNRPPEAALVLYCGGGSCEDSHLLASRLFQLGYRNLLIYRDGYPEWVAQGRPSTKGQVR